MEKLARVFFALTLIFAAAFIVFFLFYFQVHNEQTTLTIERANLRQQISTLNTEINRRGVLQQELERRIQMLETEKATPTVSSAETSSALFISLQASITQLQDDVAKKNAQIALLSTPQTIPPTSEREKVLQEDIARLKKSFDDEYLKQQTLIKQKEDEIVRLTKVMETRSGASESEQVKSLQTQISDLQKNLSKAQSDLNTSKQAVTDRDTQITALLKQVDDFQKSNQVISQKDNAAQQQIASLKTQLTALQTQLQEKTTDNQRLSAQVQSQTTEINQLKTQLSQEKVYLPIPAGESDAVRYKYLILGEDEMLAENFKKSAENFRQAQLSDLALGVLANVYIRKRNLAYQKAISEYYQQGYQDYQAKNYEKAIESFTPATTLSQEVKTDFDDDVLYYLGLSYLNLKSFSEAERYLKEVYSVKESTLKVHALYYLVKLYVETQQRTEAIRLATELKDFATYASYARDTLKKLGE